MRTTWLFIFSFLALTFLMLINIQAWECRRHFKEAQAVIDKVTAEMKEMKGKISKRDHALVHSLVDDAKMLLIAARHNHKKPQGDYDHARAISKAKGAHGFAVAADILHWRTMSRSRARFGSIHLHRRRRSRDIALRQ